MNTQATLKNLSTDDWKQEFVRLISEGNTVKNALEIVQRHENTYMYHLKQDEEFRRNVETAKILGERAKGKGPKVDVPDFPEFSKKYLKNELFYHQLQWFDIIEGRPPRDLHPSETYIEGRPTRIVVNTPPNHAKSTTITVNYCLWRMMKNPNIKIIVVSKTAEMAKKFLLQIKSRLTSDDYIELRKDFAPKGSWKEGSDSWTATKFYINGRSAEAKDPTVWAIGIGSQIYGARADIVIVDDAIDGSNATQYVKQMEWLNGEVATRLTPRTGRLFVVGTRIAEKDMYSELVNPDNYSGTQQIWTYFSQPAVLEYADDVKDWKTLWQYSDLPSDEEQLPDENGYYVKFDGETLDEIRSSMGAAQWGRMYMQEQVSEDNIFKYETVKATCQNRVAGLIPDNKLSGREGGMIGLRVIAGVDPAAAGYTAMVALGVDIVNGTRHVIDVWNKANASPNDIRNTIKDWTSKYDVKEWRVEANAFQRFLALDPELIQWLAGHGSFMTEHYTNKNKHDADFGVQAMALLFEQQLITLPTDRTENIRTLIEQLVIWQPKGMNRKHKSDTVMALWFAELKALELIQKGRGNRMYRDTPFTTAAQKQTRFIQSQNQIFA
jgi:hypothetical protein